MSERHHRFLTNFPYILREEGSPCQNSEGMRLPSWNACCPQCEALLCENTNNQAVRSFLSSMNAGLVPFVVGLSSAFPWQQFVWLTISTKASSLKTLKQSIKSTCLPEIMKITSIWYHRVSPSTSLLWIVCTTLRWLTGTRTQGLSTNGS